MAEPVDAALNFGQGYNEIGTFNGWSFWVGWSGSFSESYLPDSETYAWLVFFAPEGIFVALQSAKSTYSAVDVFAGIDYFYGVLSSPDGNTLTRQYLDSLLGVTVAMNAFGLSPPYGPLSGVSVALPAGQTFFRNGPIHLLERGIQYSTGLSVSYELIPMPIPISVSLEYESAMATAFYPIIEWNLEGVVSDNPMDKIMSGLETLAAVQGQTFVDMTTSHMAQLFLPFMRTLPVSDYLGEFLQSSSHTSEIDGLIFEAEEWLQTGDTSELPDAIRPPLDPEELYALMRPIQAGVQLAFEAGYKHGCDANSNCTTIYADCVSTVNCEVGEACRVEVTAEEISALVPGSQPTDFEGIGVIFTQASESYLMTEASETIVYMENGKAVYEFVQGMNMPLMVGARIAQTAATGYKNLELCRRKIIYPVPATPPIAHVKAEQTAIEGTSVTLQGHNFTDPDDTTASYTWNQTAGTPVTLSAPTEIQTMFTAPQVGPDGETLRFEFTIQDSNELQDTATCAVIIKDSESVCPDRSVCNGDFEQGLTYWDSTENAALAAGKSGQGAQVTADGANGDIFQLLPGVFAGDETYTATAWCKAEAGERCGIFFGDANTLENPTMYENMARQWLDGNGGWQQLRVELTLSHAERLNLFLYAPTGSVVYDDAQVMLSTEPGDMNGDGQLNIFDLQMLINCIFGSGSCEHGDLNGDGSYNIFDLQQLINKIFS